MNDISLGGINLEAALGIENPKPKARPKREQTSKAETKISHRMGRRQLGRKAASEAALEDALPNWHFNEGESYHCFTFGDVDSLTYLKMVLRQQRIKYAAICTWVIAGEDVVDLRKWHQRGLIGRVDFFVGEIFKGAYPDVYKEVQAFLPECGGRLVVFRNHSKIMAIEGERFDCLIESSANTNTNPRSEQAVITIDRKVTGDCIKLFSEIKPFNRFDCGAEPYKYGGQK